MAGKESPGSRQWVVDSPIASDLIEMWTEDQRLSTKVVAASRQDPRLRRIFLFELDESEWPDGYAACREIAHRNVSRLAEIVDEHGWPRPSLYGPEAASAAWGIAQHADGDNQLRKTFVPLLRSAVDDGEPVADHLAALVDRIALADGRPQSYGTLVQDDGDAWVLRLPSEDVERLDERRAEIGLGAWADWVASFPTPSTLWASK
jgi:hypothetical protein